MKYIGLINKATSCNINLSAILQVRFDDASSSVRDTVEIGIVVPTDAHFISNSSQYERLRCMFNSLADAFIHSCIFKTLRILIPVISGWILQGLKLPDINFLSFTTFVSTTFLYKPPYTYKISFIEMRKGGRGRQSVVA